MIETPEEESYEISAVASLTGLSTHVLRVWERRYRAVAPDRTDSKRRRYTKVEVQRLSLLKTLVENGHTISSIARLDLPALEERLAEVLSSQSNPKQTTHRLGVTAVQSRGAIREAAELVKTLTIVAEFSTLEEMTTVMKPGVVDTLIVEMGSVFSDTISQIEAAVHRLKAHRAIVVYQFTNVETFRRGLVEKITPLRAPVTASEILLACASDISLTQTERLPIGSTEVEESAAPPRLFSPEQLVAVSQRSPVVQCECPQHLAGLVESLSAFEDYSAACESRHQEDAEIHAFLWRTTAQCRRKMEEALKRVIQVEGIEV